MTDGPRGADEAPPSKRRKTTEAVSNGDDAEPAQEPHEAVKTKEAPAAETAEPAAEPAAQAVAAGGDEE